MFSFGMTHILKLSVDDYMYVTLHQNYAYDVSHFQELPDGGALDRAAVHAFLCSTAELAEATNEKVEAMKAILKARGIQ